jgi:hypothetical protein
MASNDAYEMGRDVSPSEGDSPSSGDDEDREDVVAGWRHTRVPVRKVPNNKGSKLFSSRGQSNIGVKQSPLKKVPKLQDMSSM